MVLILIILHHVTMVRIDTSGIGDGKQELFTQYLLIGIERQCKLKEARVRLGEVRVGIVTLQCDHLCKNNRYKEKH